MSLVIKNTSPTLIIVDGIEILPQTEYNALPQEEGALLADSSLQAGLFATTIHLKNTNRPQDSFTGISALQQYHTAQVANNTAISTQITDLSTQIQSLTTDKVSEASHLYFTPTRVANSAVVQGLSTSLQTLNQSLSTHSHTTDETTETTDLYYTEERVLANPEVVALRTDLTTQQQKTQFGDVGTGNYTEYDPFTGKLSFFGQAQPQGEIQFSSYSALSQGTKQPPFGLLKDTGLNYVDKGLHFNKDKKQIAFIPAHNDLSFHHQSFSVGFWIAPHEADCYVITKKNEVWAVELKGKHIKVDLKNNGSLKSAQELNWQQRNCVVVTLQDTGTSVKVSIYLNGILDDSVEFSQQLSDLNNGEIYLGGEHPGSKHFDGILDELRFWDEALTPLEIAAFYNEGQGTELPVRPLDTVVAYHMNEGVGLISNCESGNPALQISFPNANAPTWVEGLLITTGFVGGGVPCPWFSKEKEQELFFDTFLPQNYTGTTLSPQLKIIPETGDTGTLLCGIEYLWGNANETVPCTLLVETEIVLSASGNTLLSLDLPPIISTTKTKASYLSLRFFRKAQDTRDTYPAKIGFVGLSLFYKQDSI